MENRNVLSVVLVTESTHAECRSASAMLAHDCSRQIHPKTEAADTGYHVADFVSQLREYES